VFLAVGLDGSKLKPMIVYKAKPGKTIEKNLDREIDPRTVACVQENAYCDERVMLMWIEKCLKPFIAADPQPSFIMSSKRLVERLDLLMKKKKKNKTLKFILSYYLTD
jgi:hypothetical protein